MARKLLRTAIALAAVVAVAAGTIAYLQIRPLTVPALQAEENVAIKVFGLGTVEARVLAKIGFKQSGTLTELRADHGDQVSAGQLLARIDASEQQARVAKAQAQLASATAAVHSAEAAVNKANAVATQRGQISQRRQTLLARQSVSAEAAEEAQLNEGIAQAELLVAQSEIETARARLDDARAQLEYDQVLLRQHELRAPFDGIVVTRAKELGTVLPAGDALFTLIAPETVWMLAYIDEARAGDIQVGQPVEIKLRSLPQQAFRGQVTRVGIESDRVNEERRVYVSCGNCPEAFYLGEQAELFIATAVLGKALLLPQSVIADFDGTSGMIWTVENGLLHRRRATFGRRTLDGRHELTSALPSGTVVPARASADFREGRTVRLSAGASQ